MKRLVSRLFLRGQQVPPRATRPPFLRLIAFASLRGVERRFPGLLSRDAREAFVLFAAHFPAVRRAWSSSPNLTLVHGDCHLGNTFFSAKTNQVGFYDLQCVALEHPTRDVAYHLMSSCDPGDLAAGGERALVEYYVKALNARLAKNTNGNDDNDNASRSSSRFLPLDEAWDQYRAHAVWVLAAFVICAGQGDHYFSESMARLTLGRIVAACDRVDALGALRLLLARDLRLQLQKKNPRRATTNNKRSDDPAVFSSAGDAPRPRGDDDAGAGGSFQGARTTGTPPRSPSRVPGPPSSLRSRSIPFMVSP